MKIDADLEQLAEHQITNTGYNPAAAIVTDFLLDSSTGSKDENNIVFQFYLPANEKGSIKIIDLLKAVRI